MSWIGTNTGKRIDLDFIERSQIALADIATGLSNVCRFNGQISEFYSVAEHSINVAKLVPSKYRLIALLHDATEAYICDVPTPLKRMLGDIYRQVEEPLARAIGRSFGLGESLVKLPTCVKKADRVMLVTEHRALQHTALDWGPEYDDVHTVPFTPMRISNKEMAQLFTQLVETELRKLRS